VETLGGGATPGRRNILKRKKKKKPLGGFSKEKRFPVKIADREKKKKKKRTLQLRRPKETKAIWGEQKKENFGSGIVKSEEKYGKIGDNAHGQLQDNG